MATQKLEKTEWRLFLDRVSKLMDAKEAEIEIGSLRLGEQVQAKWLPLASLTRKVRHTQGSAQVG